MDFFAGLLMLICLALMAMAIVTLPWFFATILVAALAGVAWFVFAFDIKE